MVMPNKVHNVQHCIVHSDGIKLDHDIGDVTRKQPALYMFEQTLVLAVWNEALQCLWGVWRVCGLTFSLWRRDVDSGRAGGQVCHLDGRSAAPRLTLSSREPSFDLLPDEICLPRLCLWAAAAAAAVVGSDGWLPLLTTGHHLTHPKPPLSINRFWAQEYHLPGHYHLK